MRHQPKKTPNPVLTEVSQGVQGVRVRKRDLGEVEVMEEDLLVHRCTLVTIHLLLIDSSLALFAYNFTQLLSLAEL